MTIKLAYNYSTIEMEFTAEELHQYAEEIEIDLQYAYDMMKRVVDGESAPEKLGKEELSTPQDNIKPKLNLTKDPELAPTPNQIRWAKNLGMEDPEKHTRQEVGKYIQEHK